MKRKGLLLGLMIVVLACGSVEETFEASRTVKGCAKEWRCADNKVQMCTLDGWETQRDCDLWHKTCRVQCDGTKYPCCK